MRFGCGTGHCGACTVIINGQAQQSCTTSNWAAVDQTITTAEGLADDPVGAVLLQSFLDEPALMDCLNRHLCRCGTHVRILRAARQAIARLNHRA